LEKFGLGIMMTSAENGLGFLFKHGNEHLPGPGNLLAKSWQN
jgi:hypothetical protein